MQNTGTMGRPFAERLLLEKMTIKMDEVNAHVHIDIVISVLAI